MGSPPYPHEVVNANMSAAASTIFNMNQVYPSVLDGDLTNKTMKTQRDESHNTNEQSKQAETVNSSPQKLIYINSQAISGKAPNLVEKRTSPSHKAPAALEDVNPFQNSTKAIREENSRHEKDSCLREQSLGINEAK